MALLLLIIIGALVGWLGSIILRIEAAGAILRFMGVGIATSVLAGLIANSGTILGSLNWMAAGVALVVAVLSIVGFFVYLNRDAQA
jgi:hypothetical protein